MEALLKILIYIGLLALLFTFSCFPVKLETRRLPEVTETSLDLNQFSGRVPTKDTPKLLHTLLREHRGSAKSGWIYIYLKDGHHCVFKVGRTASTIGVAKRLRQWVRKCKKNLRLVRKFFVESNHELCEAMIHLELKLNGLWCGNVSCDVCEGFHKEFFKADLDVLIDCVDFWTTYFNDVEKNKYYAIPAPKIEIYTKNIAQ